jgi:hypothetical protein
MRLPRRSGWRTWAAAAAGVALAGIVVVVLRLPIVGGRPYSWPSVIGLAAAILALSLLWGLALRAAWSRPLGPAATAGLVAWTCLVPAWMLADSLLTYRLYGDDFEYVGTSRTFGRAVVNLFTPHNVHIVPAWRLLTAAVVACAGSLSRLQGALAVASYGILAATMLLAGRLVARETGRASAGMAVAIAFGTTSLMWPAGVWYSAAQANAAGLGILATLWCVQGWHRSGGAWRVAMACVATLVASWCWTVGLIAGLVAAAYLLAAWWPRRRWATLAAAAAVAVASVLAAGLDLKLGGRGIEEQSTVSFHGRSTREAFNAAVGISHTIQGLVERQLLGGLATIAAPEFQQSAMLLLAFVAAWGWSRRGSGPLAPLEAAGGATMLGGSWLAWSFRGYLPFHSLRGFVPWYDVIPYLGLLLFLAGWWQAARGGAMAPPARHVAPLTRGAALALVLYQLGMLALHQPRVDALRAVYQPPMAPSETQQFTTLARRRQRNYDVALLRAERQRRHLTKLDRAQTLARRLGVGREALIRAFGRVIYPDPPYVYDADLLDLPFRGPADLPLDRIRAEFGALFVLEPEARPPWVDPRDAWPPDDADAIGVKRPDRGRDSPRESGR